MYYEKDVSELEVATLAGGCFWCMESPFEKIIGVHSVVSGYTGGDVENPTYKEVSSGTTGHVEAVQVFYDPEIISYEDILEIFWRQIDPTDPDGSLWIEATSTHRPFFIMMQTRRLLQRSLLKTWMLQDDLIKPLSHQ